jgi:hypothetical protein
VRTPWWPPSERETHDYIETPGLEVLDPANYDGEPDSAEYTDEEEEFRQQFYDEQQREYGFDEGFSDDPDAGFRDSDGFYPKETADDLIYGYGY